jgi:signal transduction histidine kinase
LSSGHLLAKIAPAALRMLAMAKGMKIRLIAFIFAIAAMVILIGWTGHSSWRRTGELSEKLTAVQLESFRIADHLQKFVLELNNIVLRYGISHDTNDWASFGIASTNLDRWIDEQRSNLTTEQEKEKLDLINTNYDFYMAAARELDARSRTNTESAMPLLEFANFEKQSRTLLSLGFELATAHRESMNSFLASSKKALNYLRVLLLLSLALLLLSAGGLAAVVYRDLIAPLRIKLVESQALVERHEKLASLGMLAAGVAHEIRNPITAIKAWLFIQQKHLRPGSPEHEDAQVISDEINRLERIVKEVLLFARPSEPRLANVSATQLLAEVQTLLQPQLEKSNIRLACENSISARISVDPEQIKQVLINLVQNAAESIGHDGTVTLRARFDTSRLADRTRDVVILDVSDTGTGISPEVEKRLFDPFFTTKEAGTGLGLSIAARIVEKHGGALQYQTQVNRGTTFGVVLPRV